MIQLLEPHNFHTQRNNKHDPMNTCGNTTLANLLECAEVWHYSVIGQQLEDTIYEVLREPIAQAFCGKFFPGYLDNPETVAKMLAFAGSQMTGRCWISRNIPSVIGIAKMIQQGHAVGVLGRFYKGSLHYIAVTGLDDDNFIIADPFGDFTTDYVSKEGYGIKCSLSTLNKLWTGDILYMES